MTTPACPDLIERLNAWASRPGEIKTLEPVSLAIWEERLNHHDLASKLKEVVKYREHMHQVEEARVRKRLSRLRLKSHRSSSFTLVQVF